MLFPTLYRENLFDGLDPFDRMMNGTNGWGLEFPSEKRDPLFGKHAARVMRTDIRELKTGYEIDIDLPLQEGGRHGRTEGRLSDDLRLEVARTQGR